MAEMQVRNTFIDIPGQSERTPMPSPLHTAPALNSGTLQESLRQAAESSAEVSAAAARRLKPNPLNFMSQQSMVSIPESPSGVLFQKDPMGFLSNQSGMSSVPATPACNWGVLQTPTETPMNFGQFYSGAPVPPVLASPSGAYSMPAVATPTGCASFPSRTTLSLQDMIQSPKVEQKAALLSSSYQQLYQVPQGQGMTMYQPQMGLPQPGMAPQAPIQMPAQMMHHAPVPQPVQVQQLPVTTTMPAAASSQQAPAAAPCAAVALGLVPQQPQYNLSSPVVASMPPLSPPSVGLPRQSPPLVQQQAYTQPAYAMSQPQVQMMPPQAPPVIARASAAHMLPPAPAYAAPTVVMSPKASGMSPAAAPGCSESDIKTLLEVAVASGNKEAISAVMRQAQQAGMSPEKFRSLLPAPQTTA
eukprot:TRINITY_DN62838_c0_g1_i1.p1 TRINITY_DN62838_c0_g1~~TRINITY_DN62838_c0_g1_i1.p1  ORF type:complete len:431 (-),score=73.33 TRINITY_DN62838_c0_g1_i1:148-1392(-)